MDTKRAITIVLVAALVIGAAPVLADVVSVPVDGDVPVGAPESPTITLGTDSGADELDLMPFFEGDRLNITTPNGDIVVSGDPGASARIELSDIEGETTDVTAIDAGADWLELDPADKQRVDVRGDVDTLSFSAVGVNDGDTDIQVGGPEGGNAELRVHELDADEEYALYDASRDEVLGTFTADSAGTGGTTFDLPDGTHALQVRTVDTFAAPELSDPAPTGDVTERPEELSVNVTAEAFPAEVVFTLEGDEVETVTVSESGSATADVSDEVDELGEYDWDATVTDATGQSDSVSATFQTPTEITIRSEHDPGQTIDGTVTVRFFTADGTIAIQRESEDGTIPMEGLPDTDFVVFVDDADNHYSRTIYVNSIFQQENLFLLNETEFDRAENDAVRSRFVFEDLTGGFPTQDTTVQIQRAIDIDGDGTSEWQTVTGDFWGASNDFEAILQQGTRYRLVLVNQETGERQVAGTHIPTEDLSQTIRVSGLVEEARNGTGVVGLADLDRGDGEIEIAYTDPEENTEQLTISVEPRGGGDPIYEETVDGPLGTTATTVQLNESQAEEDWVVRFDAGDRHQSAIPVGDGSIGIPVGVPSWLLTLLGTMTVTFVGALYGPRTALLGAWSMVMVAAGLAMFGWAFDMVAVLVAGLVAVGMTLLARALPG